MKHVHEAVRTVLGETHLLGTERVPLSAAGNRILAEPVFADQDVPPFNRSAMDGFAVVSEDTTRGDAELEIVEEIFAGDFCTRTIRPGQAAKIMTGAPVPPGADAVVRVEDTEPADRDRIRILVPVSPGKDIDPLAKFVQEGENLMEPGRLLRPVDIGLLASAGVTHPEVYGRPRCAVLSTGDELVEPSERPAPGQIRNSNAFCLAEQLRCAGAEVELLGIGPDDPDSLAELIRKGLAADIFISTGGVSVGEKDFVSQILDEEGVEILFGKVAIKPGKPTVFGRRGQTLVFGLPGNPVSAMVTCELFTLPALRKMTGQAEPLPSFFRVRRGAGRMRTGERCQFIPAKLVSREGEWQAELVQSNGSGDLISVTYGDGLVILPPGQEPPPVGEMMEFMPLTGWTPPTLARDRGIEEWPRVEEGPPRGATVAGPAMPGISTETAVFASRRQSFTELLMACGATS